MKAIMKGLKWICTVVGGIVVFSYGLILLWYGPKKTWNFVKHSFKDGYNYKM